MYYSLLFATFLSVITFWSDSKKLDLVFTAAIFIFFSLVAGLRYFVDADYSSYTYIFNSTPIINEFSSDAIAHIHGEGGFLFILSLFKSAGFEYWVFLLCACIVSIGGKIHFYKRVVGSSALGICLYFCVNFINIEFITVRWALASSFIVLSFYFKFFKKNFLSILFFSLAICFHYFSIMYILLIMMPIYRLKIDSYFILFLVGVSLSVIHKFIGIGSAVDLLSGGSYLILKITKYLTVVESNVGIISMMRVFLYASIIFLFRCFCPEVFKDRLTYFIFALSMLTLSLTIILTYLPVFFFRSIVIADIVSIALILRLIVESEISFRIKGVISYSFTSLLMLWCLIDISIKLEVGIISGYQSLLQFII